MLSLTNPVRRARYRLRTALSAMYRVLYLRMKQTLHHHNEQPRDLNIASPISTFALKNSDLNTDHVRFSLPKYHDEIKAQGMHMPLCHNDTPCQPCTATDGEGERAAKGSARHPLLSAWLRLQFERESRLGARFCCAASTRGG